MITSGRGGGGGTSMTTDYLHDNSHACAYDACVQVKSNQIKSHVSACLYTSMHAICRRSAGDLHASPLNPNKRPTAAVASKQVSSTHDGKLKGRQEKERKGNDTCSTASYPSLPRSFLLLIVFND